MEANTESKVGDEEALKRRLNIVYFLSREGKVEQPHIITVHHLNSNVVRLRDFKRWLSEFRGREMLESFAWSYKRKYKTGYIWQDLTEDDPIIPISNYEYVLKGSLLLSPIKIIEQIKEEKEAESLATSAALKSPLVTFQNENNISQKSPVEITGESSSVEAFASTSSASSENAQKKMVVFKIDCWREEMKRIKKQRCEEIAAMENGRQFNGVKNKVPNDKGAWKWASVMRSFLMCGTVEKMDSVRRVVSDQSGKRSTISCNNEEKQRDKRNLKRKEGRRKSFFFFTH